MHRNMVGAIAIVLLTASVALTVWPQPWDSYLALLAACRRLGAVMAAIWLAYPQVSRLPSWFYALGLCAAILVALRPKLILIAIPVMAALWFLRPRR